MQGSVSSLLGGELAELGRVKKMGVKRLCKVTVRSTELDLELGSNLSLSGNSCSFYSEMKAMLPFRLLG